MRVYAKYERKRNAFHGFAGHSKGSGKSLGCLGDRQILMIKEIKKVGKATNDCIAHTCRDPQQNVDERDETTGHVFDTLGRYRRQRSCAAVRHNLYCLTVDNVSMVRKLALVK